MDFQPDTFGTLYADTYDDRHNPGTTDGCVNLISRLAGPDARILELASGTGRITLPLAERGHRIEGIEASPEMVDKMRAKPGGADIPVTIGDMADVGRDGPFDLIFLVYNTIGNLITQEAQVRLFENVGQRLAPGGRFVVETFIPDLTPFTDHQRMRVQSMDMDRLQFEAVDHDPLAQTFRFQRVRIGPDGTTLSPFIIRYNYPAELDLMARLGGLALTDRWGGFEGEPFTADSTMHVSVWQKPA